MFSKEDKKVFYIFLFFGLAIGIASIFGKNSDFEVYYKAVRDLFDYGWNKVYDPSSVVPFKYHPFCVFLFIPFSVFSLSVGKILWGLFNGLLVFHVFWMLYLNYRTKISTILITILILAHPLTWQLKFANVTFLMLWLLTVFVFNKNIFIKALCLSLLIIIKPFWAFIPMFYILSKEYRIVLCSLLLVLILSFIPYLFDHSIYYKWFLTLNHPIHSHNYSKTDNQCIYALLYRYYNFIFPYLSYLWILLSGMFFAVWYYLRFGISIPFVQRALIPEDIFSSVLVILWVGPLSWFHNYLLLIPLVAIFLERTQKHKVLIWTTLGIIMTGISLLPKGSKTELYLLGVPLLFLIVMLVPIKKSN
jgi:hypothetical protein